MTASIDSPSEGRFQFVAKFKEFSQKKKRLSLRQLLMFCLALDGGNFSSEFSSYFVTFLPHKQAHMHTEKLLSMLVCVPKKFKFSNWQTRMIMRIFLCIIAYFLGLA